MARQCPGEWTVVSVQVGGQWSVSRWVGSGQCPGEWTLVSVQVDGQWSVGQVDIQSGVSVNLSMDEVVSEFFLSGHVRFNCQKTARPY